MPDEKDVLAQEVARLRERLSQQEESRLSRIEASLTALREAILGTENTDGIIGRVRSLEEHQKNTMRNHVTEHEKILLGDPTDPKRLGLVVEVRNLKIESESRQRATRWAVGAVGVGAITFVFEVLKTIIEGWGHVGH